jgi:hypothetical protein
VKRERLAALVLSVAALVGALGYLRDPVWLIHVSSGFGRWQQDQTGTRFRWTRGRASFFVPADAWLVRVPLRARHRTSERQPFLVRIDVDDRFANLIALPDERWTEAEVRILPARGRWRRRVVRLDLHIDHTWSDRGLGVQVGEVRVELSRRLND